MTNGKKGLIEYRRIWLCICRLAGCLAAMAVLSAGAQSNPPKKLYQLWYNAPVPNLPVTHLDSLNSEALKEATPVDPAWENWSLPIGNGYMGASIFGRTTTERVQLTENSMAAKSLYGGVGLTSFAELYLDFNHTNPQNYTRRLQLNNATATVQYEQDGVTYQREYFASYPGKVVVIKLTASKKGALGFTLRPEIPYKKAFGPASKNNGRMGKVHAENGLVTLWGKLEYLNLHFEGQFKVIPTGGTLKAVNDADGDNGRLVISGADAAIIIIAAGNNYKLESHVFDENTAGKKLTDTTPPHKKVSDIMEQAAAKTYAQLLAAHKKDYCKLFERAVLDLGAVQPSVPTDQLLKNYKAGIIDHYLEELYFQYGRYLLICSSRPGTLPPNLQGIWSQYDISPWTGGYWHNINIQMNYWPVFNTNLAELFQSFVDYNLAYRNAATKGATRYITANNPQRLSPAGDNGWTIGTGASAYNISTPGNHSGPGTGTMTSKMFWDYYEFTADKKLLKNLVYPALTGMSKFLAKVTLDTGGLLLTYPSFSPEQRRGGQEHYKTMGCAFDQQMIYESHADVLKAAKILQDHDPALLLFENQMPKLDPVQVGWSGQIKEYREEKYYGEIVDPKHRHISQLIGLYPGTLINSNTPAWLDAAKVTLNNRGDKSTGWAMAFRLNLWARAKDGDRAYLLYKTLLQKCTLDNLWDTHPPFQIDGNFGGTAGVAEMLLQSHEGFIDLLPALPTQWAAGLYSGLVARGNFEVSARWQNHQPVLFTIKSKIGDTCRLKYFNIEKAVVKNGAGAIVKTISSKPDFIAFETRPGEVYTIHSIPGYTKLANPGGLTVKQDSAAQITVQWTKSPGAVVYNLYIHTGDAPGYTLLRPGITATTFTGALPVEAGNHYIIRLTAVGKNGRESSGTTAVINN